MRRMCSWSDWSDFYTRFNPTRHFITKNEALDQFLSHSADHYEE